MCDKKYYNEEIVRNSQPRQDYVDSIHKFLSETKSNSKIKISEFISPEKLKDNYHFYKSKYIEMLGFPLTEERQAPEVEKVFVARNLNVDIYRLYFTFPCGIKGYGLFFKQIKRENNPFILTLHGGSGTPEIISDIYMDSANYNHLTRRITDMGADVFVPQLLLWDISTFGNEYNRQYIDGKLRQLGGSVTALEVWLLSSYIDWFILNEDIDEQRIGVAGLSYGGMYTIYLSAYDERVKSAYSCSWVSDCFTNSWADWSYKNSAFTFTTVETAALIAPRALVVAMGDSDELFKAEETVIVSKNIREYYKVYNKENKFKSVIFSGCHETDKSDEELKFLFDNL